MNADNIDISQNHFETPPNVKSTLALHENPPPPVDPAAKSQPSVKRTRSNAPSLNIKDLECGIPDDETKVL